LLSGDIRLWQKRVKAMRIVLSTVCSVLVVSTALFALALGNQRTSSDEELSPSADKPRIAQLDERYAKVVAGVRKLKEAEVVALIGPAHTMKRPVATELGQASADLELGWELTTTITIRYTDGKVSEVSGVFAEYLPDERVTPANFHRVRIGMTQKEVVAVLGNRFATLTVGDEVGDQWGATHSITLRFDKDNLLVSQTRLGQSYGPRN
jgi:hypothetical protein